VITWSSVATVGTVPTENWFQLWKGFTDYLHRVGHFVFSCFVIDIPHHFTVRRRTSPVIFTSYLAV
jgi:hypothetical protein